MLQPFPHRRFAGDITDRRPRMSNGGTISSPRPRPCPVCRSAMIAQPPVDDGTLFRCDDCGCVVDLRARGEPADR